MKLLILTPIYEVTTGKSGATPIVHYYAREWVKLGHEVKAICVEPKYPKLFYIIGKAFQKRLNSLFNFVVPIECPEETTFTAEGVYVRRMLVKKLKPHSRYPSKRVEKSILQEIEGWKPDRMICHWDNPCLDLVNNIRKMVNFPISLVFHSNYEEMYNRYGDDFFPLLKNLDYVGFRSRAMKDDFEMNMGEIRNSFYAFSGVSPIFLSQYEEKQFITPVRHFVYSGTLIARKFPEVAYRAVADVYCDGNFHFTFIGDGLQKKVIEDEWKKKGQKGDVVFLGRVPRTQIPQYLKENDVFVMISRDEVFGLVYLEAMAMGCITIGSRKEGIDGIIMDGENGFLCESGNLKELIDIIIQIKNMSQNDLKNMSRKARETAERFSDFNVAKDYLESIGIKS